MAGVSSTSATFRVARQSGIGTAATTGFVTGLMEQSGMYPAFDEMQITPEHGAAGLVDRATARKSATPRSGYLVRGSFRSRFYPNLIGLLLRGAGFGSTSSGTNQKTHVFTLATRPNHAWLTILAAIGGRERRATDARVSRLTLTAQPDGLKWSGEYRALTEANSAGTETGTNEDTNEILPSVGSLTMKYDPAGANTTILTTSTSELNRLTLDIANPLDEADQALFRFGRADLAQTGMDITGTVEGAPMTWTNYDTLMRNGGANPSATPAICSLTYAFSSSVNIPGSSPAAPYSFTVTIPRVEVTIDEDGFTPEGENLIRWTYSYRMIDTTATPITLTLINNFAAYSA